MSNASLSTHIDRAISIALEEDIGSGDLTAEYFVQAGQTGQAVIIAKQNAVAAGVEVSAEVFRRVDPSLRVEILAPSGTAVAPYAKVIAVSGPVRSILTAERVALNFLQRLSGVATLTRRYADAVQGSGAKILDTRKTTPGLRAL